MRHEMEPKHAFARRGFVFAAIGVGAIGLAAVVAITAAIIGGPDTDSSASPASEPVPHTPTAEERSICGLEGFETTNTLESAPDAAWELVGTVAAPTEPNGAGPGVLDDDGFRSCYAHTAEGALLAAINYVALGSDSRHADRMQELFVPGPGVSKAFEDGSPSGSPSSTRLQVAGFKVNSYNADEAVVDIAWTVTSQDGALVSYPVVLHWYDGDWKVVINDDGQPPFAPSPLQSLGGYIPWAGV